MNQSYSESFSIEEQSLRKRARQRTVIGIILIFSPIAILLLIFYIQNFVPQGVVIFLIICFGAFGMAGLVLIFWYGKGASMFFHGVDLLKKIAPPDPIFIGRNVVIDKKPVYGIGAWGSNVLMFIAFYSSERLSHRKVKIPRTIWTWEYKHNIEDVKVARREGTYTIPIGEDEYLTGEGILYALIIEGGVYVTIQRDFSSEQLLKIVADLENEVTSYGTSRQSIDSVDD